MQQDDIRGDGDSLRTRIQPGVARGSRDQAGWLRKALAGRYRIERELGAGGMGRVYLATDIVLERPVALKTILPEILADPAWVARFRLEAASAAGLQHPNLVQVHEILELQSTPVLVMEYVEGDSLRAAVADRGLSHQDVCEIMAAVCEGISHAHDHGVIHCDIKPGNILLSRDGVPKVGDFGLALRRPIGEVGAPREDPEQLGVVGSPAYMSPEQTLGDPRLVTSRTDLYSLGATLYFALTGRPPIRGTSATEVLERVSRGVVIPPRELDPAISRDLEAICLKALHHDPDLRYATAAQMGRDLRSALAGLPVSARRYGLWESTHRAVRAHKEAFALGLAALLVMSIGLGSAVSVLHATAHEAVLAELRRKVTSLASTAVMLVDPALVQAVRGPEPDKLPESHRLATLLESIRTRSPDDVRYVWVMRRRDASGAQMEFVASSESFLPAATLDKNRDGRVDEDEAPARPGDPFDASPYPELIRGLEAPTADRSTAISDQWGIVLSGYAPVLDEDGRSIAVLGVDVAQKGLYVQFRKLQRAQWLALAMTGALALLCLLLMLSFLIGLWRRSGVPGGPRKSHELVQPSGNPNAIP